MRRRITRRSLLATGLVTCGTALLAGCSWTPRNAGQPQNDSFDSDVSSTDETSPSAGNAPLGSASVDDGLLLVRGGTFVMGSPTDEPWRVADEVQHEVTVDDFYLSPLEVSEADFGRLMGAGAGSVELPATDITCTRRLPTATRSAKGRA